MQNDVDSEHRELLDGARAKNLEQQNHEGVTFRVQNRLLGRRELDHDAVDEELIGFDQRVEVH